MSNALSKSSTPLSCASSYEEFLTALNTHRGLITKVFEDLLGSESVVDSPSQRVWAAPDDEAALAEFGFQKLDETIDASPALVGNELFMRGEKHLYCIAVK